MKKFKKNKTQKGKNGKAKSCRKGVVENANELLASYEIQTAQSQLGVLQEFGMGMKQFFLI